MAGLYRLGAAVLLALTLGMLWTPAHASFPATYPPGACTVAPCFQYNTQATGWFPTAAESCAHYVSTISPPATVREGQSDTYCPYNITSFGNPGGNGSAGISSASAPPATPSVCPENSTLGGTDCTCNEGYVEEGNSCLSQQAADNESCKQLASGLNLVGAPLMHYGSPGLTACFAGFTMSGTGSASGGGQTELYGPFKCSGENASSCSVVPKPESITATCAPGSYPGTVNGVQVCVPPSNSVEAPKTTTVAPPEGGGTTPEIPGAPAGTTSEEKEVTGDGQSVTIKTTYKDVNGVPTGTKTETVPKSSYCAENPKAPGCESLEASTFGGNCAGGFTFKGDAIQGAMAKEIYKQNCIINDTSDESALYAAKVAIPEGDLTLTLPGNEVVSVGAGDFDASDAIGGAACITDKTVVVWGKTVVLPFSVVCPAMGYLKTILLAISWLTAAGIVIGRKT